LWEAVTGENPSKLKDSDDAPQRPVETVSWFDAVRFCNALSAKLGLAAAYTIGEGAEPEVTCDFAATGFRLPTEAEWEYAARSGGDAFVYAGSDDLAEVGWYDDTEYDDEGDEVSPASVDCPQPVGGKAPTRRGLHDLSGNVSEWCWDRGSRYPTKASTDPVGEDKGLFRVFRGGSWSLTAGFARAACRGPGSPDVRSGFIGLRLSRTIA
jgi:formylglycine-generating enzyme required for sulfatase activity